MFLVHSFEFEIEMNRVEEGEVGSNRPRAIHRSGDLHAGASQRHRFLFRDHLQELYAAGGDAGQKEFGGRDTLARDPVLNGAHGNKEMVSTSEQRQREKRGGTTLAR